MPVDVSTNQQAGEKIVPLGTKNGIEMAIRCRTEKTLGKIIAKADSPDLIDGVRIEPLQIYPDDRGFFHLACPPRKRIGGRHGAGQSAKHSGLLHADVSWHHQGDSLSLGADRFMGTGIRDASGFSCVT